MILTSGDLHGLDPNNVCTAFVRAGQPAQVVGGNIQCMARPQTQALLKVKRVADKTSYPNILTALADVRDQFDNDPHQLAQVDCTVAYLKAKELLGSRRLLNFASILLDKNRAQMITVLRDALLPAFFEQYPAGAVYVVMPEEPLHWHLTNLNLLQRVSVLGANLDAIMEALAVPKSMSALGLQTPSQIISPALAAGLFTFLQDTYGFLAHNRLMYYFIFLFGHPESLNLLKEDQRDEMLVWASTIMDSRYHSESLKPARTFPFSTHRYSGPEIENWIESYTGFVNDTLRWICDLTHFPKKAPESGSIDVDFAIQSYLTLFLLIVLTYRTMVSNDAYERKASLFDIVDLHTALITTRSRRQTGEWKRLLSGAFTRSDVIARLQRYPTRFSEKLAAQLQKLRDDALAVLSEGIIYRARMQNNRIPLLGPPPSLETLEEFEPNLLRELRNIKHGLSISNYEILKWHTGVVSNDLPDYAVALLLALLADRSPYPLARS